MFTVWVFAITALSVFSWSNNNILTSIKLTSSGFVMHCIAYFVGVTLCCFSFDKKNISFVLWTGLLIFLFSVVLEVVQFYLPYRTFNIYDVVGNGIGVLLFGVWMLCINHAEAQGSEVRGHPG